MEDVTDLDLTVLADELSHEFTDLRLEHGGGALYLPATPVDLGYTASEQYPDDLDDRNAYEVLRPIAPLETLIRFEWNEGSGSTFEVALDMLRVGDRAYITLPPDEAVDQAWEAFVAVHNPDAVEILDALFFDLMWDNGESYGIELFSSLPTRIESSVLGRETVRAGFHLYLDWDETRSRGAWTAAAAHLPDWMRGNEALAGAADALAADDSEANRDHFIEAYIDATYNT
jgi:hypothetical protein